MSRRERLFPQRNRLLGQRFGIRKAAARRGRTACSNGAEVPHPADIVRRVQAPDAVPRIRNRPPRFVCQLVADALGIVIADLRAPQKRQVRGATSPCAARPAIDRAIDLKDAYNIRVLNLSLGRTVRESYALDPLCQAVERAWQAGIVVVVAAGNNGRNNR